MQATFEVLLEAVKTLPLELRACLIELMNADIKFVAGEWGRCPMTTLTFAKRHGECDIPGTKATGDANLLSEMNISDGDDSTFQETAKELSELLGVPTRTVERFARAWDKHYESVRDALSDIITMGTQALINVRPTDREYINLYGSLSLSGLRDGINESAIAQIHRDLRNIIDLNPPYTPPTLTYRVKVGGEFSVEAVDHQAAWEQATAQIGKANLWIDKVDEGYEY